MIMSIAQIIWNMAIMIFKQKTKRKKNLGILFSSFWFVLGQVENWKGGSYDSEHFPHIGTPYLTDGET